MTDPHRQAAIAYVDALVRETGLDLTNLARKAGVSSTTLTRFRNDPHYRNSLSGRTLKKLSDVTTIPLPASLGGAGAERSGFGAATGDASRSTGAIPRDLPVLGRPRGAQDSYCFVEDEARSYIERPWFLFGQPDAYAVYINESSMEPVLRQGHLVYVAPAIPPSSGDDVVVQLSDGNGLIKRLRQRTSKRLILEQFNPKKQTEVDIERVRSIDLVVATLRNRI